MGITPPLPPAIKRPKGPPGPCLPKAPKGGSGETKSRPLPPVFYRCAYCNSIKIVLEEKCVNCGAMEYK